MNSDASTAPGWFGKLSSLGDFASRRVPAEWVEACDDWLERSMTASRAQLEGQWLETYLSAPVWRFAWAPGVIDRRWWFGVLMPSCDNVGRYFPLVVVQSRERPPVERIGLDHLDLWWGHVARAALQTLHEHSEVDEFEADLAATPPWPLAPRSASTLPATDAQERFHVPVGSAVSLIELARAWAAQEMLDRLQGCSIWWPMAGADLSSAPAVTVTKGLPQAARFADLLTLRW